MKKFWSWVLALVISPFIMALLLVVVYGVIWLIINVGNPESGHLPEIVGGLLIIIVLTISVKVLGISDKVIEWIDEKRRGY